MKGRGEGRALPSVTTDAAVAAAVVAAAAVAAAAAAVTTGATGAAATGLASGGLSTDATGAAAATACATGGLPTTGREWITNELGLGIDAATPPYVLAPVIGPGRYCSPRHLTHFKPSFLDVNGIQWRGEQYLAGPTQCAAPPHTYSSPHNDWPWFATPPPAPGGSCTYESPGSAA